MDEDDFLWNKRVEQLSRTNIVGVIQEPDFSLYEIDEQVDQISIFGLLINSSVLYEKEISF